MHDGEKIRYLDDGQWCEIIECIPEYNMYQNNLKEKRKMEYKDWITMFVPIICNGFLIFIFQNIITKEIARQEKKQGIRDDVLRTFWNKLQKLNDTFIQINVARYKDPTVAGRSLEILQLVIVEIYQYYDTNEFDLKFLTKRYTKFQQCWLNFKNTYNEYSKKTLTKEMQIDLGIKLQKVKEANQVLIHKVREEY